MPHESTVDPEEPIDLKSWGHEKWQQDAVERHRTLQRQTSIKPSHLDHIVSIQTYPDLPLHVTHDHDDDGDPEDDTSAFTEPDFESEYRTRVTYTPPKKKT